MMQAAPGRHVLSTPVCVTAQGAEAKWRLTSMTLKHAGINHYTVTNLSQNGKTASPVVK
jgi:hypothetical protein